MGALANYLAQEFVDMKSRGWRCRSEVELLSPRLAHRFGFRPHADVMLEKDGRRAAVEFRVDNMVEVDPWIRSFGKDVKVVKPRARAGRA